jgi:hypothetical protein
MLAPKCVKGTEIPMTMVKPVRRSTGAAATLWTKGTFWVRIIWTINVCENSPSTNQPDWKSDWCSEEFTPKINHKRQKVVMSKTELMGPIKTMNRVRPSSSHFRGRRTNSCLGDPREAKVARDRTTGFAPLVGQLPSEERG